MSEQGTPLDTGNDKEHERLLENTLVNMSDEEEATKQRAVPEEEPTMNVSEADSYTINEPENLKTFPPCPQPRADSSQFESEDGMVNKPLSPILLRDDPQQLAKSPLNTASKLDQFERENSPSQDFSQAEDLKTMSAEKNKREKELTDILVDAAFKKLCPDHNQMIVTICTDFSCPKRFWCGICCVKSKDLYVRFSTHMTLISDFLEENITRLYQVKTFTDSDKSNVGGKLNEIVAKNQANFDDTWKLIERDIETYKNEVVARIESSKAAVKTRFNRSTKSINNFYDELKERVRCSKTRDVSLELEALKVQVTSGKKDALEAIESIGNKVNIDIFEVESLNMEFDKTRDFVDFIYTNYPDVRQNTIPNYVSMEKSISGLADKVEALSMPKIKSVLEDANKELDSLLVYYESLLSNELPKLDQKDYLLEYLSQRDEETNHKAAPVQKDVDESIGYRGKVNFDGRKANNVSSTMREPERVERKTPTQSNERAVDHATSLGGQKAAFNQQRPSQPGPINPHFSQQNSKILSIYSSFPASQLMNSEVLDLTDRNSSNIYQATGSLFDGCLCPVYNEAEIEGIEREGSLAMTTENREFIPVIYLHNNAYLFSSFQKKDTTTNPAQIVYGFKILLIGEEQKAIDPNKIKMVYSSDSIFLSTSKIVHITVLERESDNINLVCIYREDGYIYLLTFYVHEDNEVLVEMENSIAPQSYEGQITSIKRLGNSDFLVCTNSRGEILTFDTIRCELISSEKSRPRLPSLRRYDRQRLLRARELILPHRFR
jgi:hypothetical protein